jgi:glycosyltransferase involved in cell wall biosynthesis
MIKVLFLSTSDNIGGAAKATLKLYKSLFQYDLRLRMLVKKKITKEKSIRKILTFLPATIHVKFDELLLSAYHKRERNFWSLAILPDLFLQMALRFSSYNILQLNWVNAGFVPIKILRNIKKPVIWRLSDSWAFTGGCHIPFSCEKYVTGCGACPQLNSVDEFDLSRQTLLRKLKSWENVNLTLVAPSKWIASNARKSLLFKNRKIVHIPTGVEIDVFKPLNIEDTRKKLGLPLGKKIILFGAVEIFDPNKGFHLLIEALNYLYSNYRHRENIELVIFGYADKIDFEKLNFKSAFTGLVSDADLLNEYYAAADVFVLPSIMENSPNTVVEALSAGTPVVAFDACGTSELIDHLTDGYLASPYITEDLCNGIIHVLEQSEKDDMMRKKAREKVEARYNIKNIAGQYYQLYKEISENNATIS